MAGNTGKTNKPFLLSKVFFKNLIYALVFATIIVGGLWIWLAAYTGHGDTVVVPPLEGLTIGEAEEKLHGRGLEAMVIDSIWSENAIGGTVVDQVPKGGNAVKDNRTVLLTIYRFAADAEILGIAQGDVAEVAMIKLRNKGVHFDTKYEPDVLLDGMVIRVEKKGKTLDTFDEIVPGQKVTLVIGRRGDEKVIVPNVYGMTLDSARVRLQMANLSVGSALYIGEFPTKEDSTKAVVSRQSPEWSDKPETQIGSGVDLWMSDPSEVKTFRSFVPDSLKEEND